MAVGTATALLAASTAFSAGSSFLGGRQQAKDFTQQGEYNAQIYEQQAGMIQAKKKILNYQWSRKIGKTTGAIVAQTAGKGLELSGSPLAVLADVKSEMLFDQAIDNYNLNVERNYALSGAAMSRYQGSQMANQAKWAGYTNAFSTILKGGAQMFGGGGNPLAFKSPNISTSSGLGYRKDIYNRYL